MGSGPPPRPMTNARPASAGSAARRVARPVPDQAQGHHSMGATAPQQVVLAQKFQATPISVNVHHSCQIIRIAPRSTYIAAQGLSCTDVKPHYLGYQMLNSLPPRTKAYIRFEQSRRAGARAQMRDRPATMAAWYSQASSS